jgi:4-hydroxyphenylacetate 3-monooxygenase
MIRTGAEYRDSLRDSREVFINGERVKDITTHPSFKPVVDIRARIYDMQHDPATAPVMTVQAENGEVNAVGNALPHTQGDWWAKRRATDTVIDTVGGVVTRVGDETVGEMWSLYDGQDVLAEIDPPFPFTRNSALVIVRPASGRTVACKSKRWPGRNRAM